ncbi:50S ribosomal protein L31e, partial [mine drainage metagenome]
IDPKVNEKIWEHGRKKIASSISVKVIKLQDGTAEVIFP